MQGWVETIDAHQPARGLEQCRQHLDRGRLARAVWSQKRKDLTLAHGERHVVDGDEITEPLFKMIDTNHCRRHFLLVARSEPHLNGGRVRLRRGEPDHYGPGDRLNLV